MTPLGARIAARIAADGPMTLADYMAACLWDPAEGYYATRDPLGAAGDFTTAPEISQMFGECLGLCLAQAWTDQGAPERLVLAELGPGRGTLMADVLRAARAVPGFRAAAEVHLVEASPALRARQGALLGPAVAAWHDRVESLPEGPLYLIANEFFDALPIRQFVRDPAGWRERLVAAAGGRLAFVLGPAGPVPALAHRLDDTLPGEVVEWRPALPPVAAELGRRIAAQGGAALIVDYGGWRGRGDTFQAVRGHAPADPLAAPGTADLTAHVDFAEIARAARPAAAAGPVPQGLLLRRLGIDLRAERLAAGLAGERLALHRAAHRRLTHDDEMGRVFRGLALYPAAAPPPPGFA